MGNDEASTTKRRSNELGPTGEHVAENLQRLRQARGYTMQQLRQRMQDLGRPLPATGVIKTEQKDRRVDVDDLVALALALNVSPLALLLPPLWSDEQVAITAEVSLRARTAWLWGEGRAPANDWATGATVAVADDDEAEDKAEREFFEQREAYEALTHPPARRRAAQHPANVAAETVSAMVGRLVRATGSGNSAAVERQLRITKNRLAQLQNEVEQIELELGDSAE